MKTLEIIIDVIEILFAILSALYFMRVVYVVIGIFATRRFKPAKKQHRYAVLVAARNEETVIGNLINSLRAQDYPSELIDIFVVADNCTDKTAEVARSLGVYCYERNDTSRRTKGFALQFLVNCIKSDFGIESYDGYFIFDADNLLKKDYITRMNESLDAGEKIITGYRNTKNFDDNWISASYGVHWLTTVRFENRARSMLHLATRIQGTGYMFASDLIKDGWNYTGLTEDRAFCADAVAKGYKISFNNRAEFYDEQPVNFKIAMRQRIRWAKGNLNVCAETGGKLLKHIFVTEGVANRDVPKEKGNGVKRLFNNLRQRFMSFDMLTIVFPYSFAGFVRKILVSVLKTAAVIVSASYFSNIAMPSVLKLLNVNLLPTDTRYAVLFVALISIISFWISYFSRSLLAIAVFVFERKRIMKIKWYKKIWFCLTFPLFDTIGKIATLIAVFTKVEWKPIPHTAAISISEINDKINK